MNIIDEEWENFISVNSIQRYDDTVDNDETEQNTPSQNQPNENISFQDIEPPKASDIYISTKSKIAYLTNPVDLKIFWDIPVIPYGTPKDGVIKKQIKINSLNPEELNIIQDKLKKELYYEEQIMSSINNPSGRIKFKDIRKITIGISKKDIMSYRSKKKQAFYNCFVMILRIKIKDIFKEFHIKIFNTGKLEIPGVQNDEIFEIVLIHIVNTLQPFISIPLTYKKTSDTVLINSNFNCGFYINREVLYDILKYKYHIQAIYDPCSYPGIQCKFYYNKDISIQNGKQITKEIIKYKDNEVNKDNIKKKDEVEVSFMIFRTGSVLIVGMCDDKVLIEIYEFLKTLLTTEFKHICQKIITSSEQFENKHKKHKIRKKTIVVLNNDNDNENDNDNVSNNQTKFNGKHLPIDNERTIL